MRRFAFLAVPVVLALPLHLRAQCAEAGRRVFLDDAPNTVQRMNALRDPALTPAMLYRASTPRSSTASAARSPVPCDSSVSAMISLLPFMLRSEINSGYVVDRNNGSLWGGRGVNTQISGGASLHAGVFSAAIRPELNYQQNRDFVMRAALLNHNEFSNPFYARIDLPQRFGATSYTTVSPGQSFARADVGPVGAGVATENLWWGPGLRESMVLSNTADGFPHAFLETNRPVNIGIGLLAASAFWGRLTESKYFDTIPSNDHRLFTGAGFTFQPKGATNLTFGFTRLFTYAWDSLSFNHFVPFFAPVLKEQLATPDNPKGLNSDDQRLSAFFDYRIPDPGFEVYGEYGREDHSWDLRDLVGEPEHSAAYLIGFQRLAAMSGERTLRVQGEWVNLQDLRPGSPDRSTPVYYVHEPQGHTQQGQMLGAGIGPGAESQFIAVDVMTETRSLGGFLERVRRDETSAPAIASRVVWPPKHDLELTAGMRAMRTVGAIDVSAQLSYSYRLQRTFIDDESNLRFALQAGWKP